MTDQSTMINRRNSSTFQRLGVKKSTDFLRPGTDDDERFLSPSSSLNSRNSASDEDAKNASKSFTVQPRSHYSTAKALHMRKRYGLINCLKIIIGCTVGSGIFTTPNHVFEEVHNESKSLIIWFAFGCVAWIGALCYAELGTTFPVSSGDYAYLNESFGEFFGFLYQWSANLVFVPSVNAILSLVIANNLIVRYTGNDDSNVSPWSACLFAMAILMFVSYVICASPQFTESLRHYTFIIKMTVIILIVICALTSVGKHGIYRYTSFFLHEKSNVTRIIKHTHNHTESEYAEIAEYVNAIYQASFSFLGFNYLNLITEELRNPIRTLPLALYISMPIVVSTYLLVNFSYFVGLSETDIVLSKVIATKMVQESVSESVSRLLEWIIPTMVAFAVCGSLVYRITAYSRVAFVGSRMGHWPRVFGLLDCRSHTPSLGIAFSTVLSCTYLTFVGWMANIKETKGFKEFDYLIVFSTHLEMAFVGLSVYALIYMRIKRPDIQRPVKLPLILPIIYAFVSTVLYLTPIFFLLLHEFSSDEIEGDEEHDLHDREKTLTYLSTIAGSIFVIVTGVPAYFLALKTKRVSSLTRKIHVKAMIMAQKVMLSLHEKKIKREKDRKSYAVMK